MNRLRGTAVIVGLCVALTASSAWAESSPFVGRWHWNRAQSTLPPGEPPPNGLLRKSLASGTQGYRRDRHKGESGRARQQPTHGLREKPGGLP